MGSMKYLSLFSGIGGFELGIQQAYEKKLSDNSPRGNKSNINAKQYKQKQRPKPLCIGYSEIDKYAISIYKKHFPKHKNYGDITKIIASELPDHDLLVGGFPCQSFSIAGKRGGFQDTRGTLFFNIAEIAQIKRPRLLLLENVKGLMSHDEGNTFATIISTLDELGYDCQWQVLNSKNFGVPQNRERVFIIGHLRGTSRPKVFPIGESDGKDNKNKSVARCLNSSDWRGPNRNQKQNLIEITKDQSQGYRVYDPKGISLTLASEAGGVGAKTGLYAIAPNKKQIDLTNMPNRPFQLKEVRTEKGKLTRKEIRKKENRDSTLRGKDDKKYIPKTDNLANCLTTGKHNIEKWTFKDTKIRRLTPTECERLQGFPDGWTEGVSDTQRYKALGNAVTVNVIKAIWEKVG